MLPVHSECWRFAAFRVVLQGLELFRSAGPSGSAKRVPAPADGWLPAVLAEKPFVHGLNLILYQYTPILLLDLPTQCSKTPAAFCVRTGQ